MIRYVRDTQGGGELLIYTSRTNNRRTPDSDSVIKPCKVINCIFAIVYGKLLSRSDYPKKCLFLGVYIKDY